MQATNTTDAPSAPVNVIPPMQPAADFEHLVRLAAHAVKSQCSDQYNPYSGILPDRMPAQARADILRDFTWTVHHQPDGGTVDPGVLERALEAGIQRYDKWKRQQRHQAFLETVGIRYADATLESYQIEHDAQRPVVDAIGNYAAHILENVTNGVGVVLFGPCGTGKDHLLIGLAKRFIDAEDSGTVAWVSGQDLFAQFRKAIHDDEDSEPIVERCVNASVLILSDPAPSKGAITDYQEATLYRIIDLRYRNMRPTWVSLNVADGGDADARLGAAITDRLRDGALCLKCDWPSFRRALQ